MAKAFFANAKSPNSMNNPESTVPVRRPHLNLDGRRLYFLISKRSHLELSTHEQAIWECIDGQRTTKQIESRLPGATAVLTRLSEAYAVELVPDAFPKNRKHVLVIEPHMDDAVLSVGGWMWQQRNQAFFDVVSVVGRSNFTSYHKIDRDYFDEETVSTLRKRESELVLRVLGGRHTVLEMQDAPLRYESTPWNVDWLKKNRRSISAFINDAYTEAELARCIAMLAPVFESTEADEVWIPLGVGTSADHEMTRDACLILLTTRPGLLANRRLYMYADVPYSKYFPAHLRQLVDVLKLAGARCSVETQDISDDIQAKHRLVSIFASQFKLDYMAPRIEATARLLGRPARCMAEFLLRIHSLPGCVSIGELYSGRRHEVSLIPQLTRWARRNERAKRIVMLIPMGVGRWREYMQQLLGRFPAATFDVHLSADATHETSRLQSPRIRIHPVQPSPRGWVLRVAQLAVAPRGPTVVFTSRHFYPFRHLIRAALALSDTLPAVTMGHLIRALRQVDCTKPPRSQ